jgi:hypothetical protein
VRLGSAECMAPHKARVHGRTAKGKNRNSQGCSKVIRGQGQINLGALRPY